MEDLRLCMTFCLKNIPLVLGKFSKSVAGGLLRADWSGQNCPEGNPFSMEQYWTLLDVFHIAGIRELHTKIGIIQSRMKTFLTHCPSTVFYIFFS